MPGKAAPCAFCLVRRAGLGRNSCWGWFTHILYAVLTTALDNSYHQLQISQCFVFALRPGSRIHSIDRDSGKKKVEGGSKRGFLAAVVKDTRENGVF